MLRSFLNYPGGKYRLLPQILPLFPSSYEQFVDLFTGSAVVSVNGLLNVPTLAYDNNLHLIQLLNYVKKTSADQLLKNMFSIIEEFKLSDTNRYGYKYYGVDSGVGLSKVNKQAYLALRDYYNQSPEPIILYALVVFGFNNQIRFNKSDKFNNPVGKRDFNNQMQQKLIDFSNCVKSMDINFIAKDFRDVPLAMNNSFYYVDPPYLISTAVYNENGGWSEQDEYDLLSKLDQINSSGNKFALSNVLSSKGRDNTILSNWARKYKVNYLNMSYSNSNYQTSDKGGSVEILITNYEN